MNQQLLLLVNAQTRENPGKISRALPAPHAGPQHGPFPCLACRPCPIHPIPSPSLAQPHKATLNHMPMKQVLGLDWDLYFINADNMAAPDTTTSAAPSPASHAPHPAVSHPIPTARHLLVMGVTPQQDAGGWASHTLAQRGELCWCSAAVCAQAQH